MTIDAIKLHHLEAAALVDDLDEALLGLMKIAGITTGDVAGVVFSHIVPWSRLGLSVRRAKLIAWIETERRHEERQVDDVRDRWRANLSEGW